MERREITVMERLEFAIDRVECSNLAHEIFMRTSGVNREGKKYEKMRTAALQIRNHIEKNVEIRFSCIYCEEVQFQGRKVWIQGQLFTCNAFEQISATSVEGAYLYAVCAGDFALPQESLMNQLYADIWGTAFADAVRILIRKELAKQGSLSESFGPGFYGMEVTEMEKMDALLDFESLGIQLKNSRIMVPLKSCAGIYFKINETYEKINTECNSCMGTHSSCMLCQMQGGKDYV